MDSERLAKCINELWSAVTLMESKEAVRLLFKDLFSHTEIKMFAKRLAVSRMLLNGLSYDEINKALKVTDRTIAHINNVLAEKGEGLRKAHLELNQIEKVKGEREHQRIERLSKTSSPKLPGQDVLPKIIGKGLSHSLKLIARKQKKRSAKMKLGQ